MPKKITYTASATDSKTGQRVHGTGETTVSDTTAASQYESTASFRIAAQGYKKPSVHITSVKDC